MQSFYNILYKLSNKYYYEKRYCNYISNDYKIIIFKDIFNKSVNNLPNSIVSLTFGSKLNQPINKLLIYYLQKTTEIYINIEQFLI